MWVYIAVVRELLCANNIAPHLVHQIAIQLACRYQNRFWESKMHGQQVKFSDLFSLFLFHRESFMVQKNMAIYQGSIHQNIRVGGKSIGRKYDNIGLFRR